MKLHGDRLLVSNTSRGELLVATVGRDGRPGPLRTLSRTGTIDDFHVDADGSMVAATHATSVIRVCSDGRIEMLLSSGVDGSTATTAGSSPGKILVLTTATPLGGLPGAAALIDATLPTGGRSCGG